MSIVTQTDKRTGITYAYDTTYYWDKEKRQSRSKRICVGKIDPETGDIVPTRGRAKKVLNQQVESLQKQGQSLLSKPDICIMEQHIF